MTNLVANFEQILSFAEKMKMPLTKKRGIIREYLQSKFIADFYSQPAAKKMVFIGGTSLRLLRDIPRFSEDLDFDNHGLKQIEVEKIVQAVVNGFLLENIQLEFKSVAKGKKTYFTLKFPNLLYDLKITTNPKEKLMIKVDYNDHWQLKTKVVLMNKYGFVEQVVTNQFSEILRQKLTAYVGRKQIQPRDMYDIVWIFGQQPELFDFKKIKELGFRQLFVNVDERLAEVGVTMQMKKRLRPFLFNEAEVRKLDFFPQVIKQTLGSD
ncbi:nucleotidyl transferase AbiEii/AbiGii toxin family protein [Patescibacteria group bacterium]|nr:nucleotidyl transferase AbiEii/AbiGii toxin family protein [Patescibacteria group bacterium]MBU1885366.1 nucleotidyl transferase AbiEii/AbiGii toxin family protein [Patescibacteria group bacterium]